MMLTGEIVFTAGCLGVWHMKNQSCSCCAQELNSEHTTQWECSERDKHGDLQNKVAHPASMFKELKSDVFAEGQRVLLMCITKM